MSGESRAKSDLQAGSESVGARFRSENRQPPRGRFTLMKRRSGTRQVMRYSTTRADAGLFAACMYVSGNRPVVVLVGRTELSPER